MVTPYYQAESIKPRVRVCTPIKKDEGDSKSVSRVDHIGRRNSVDARFLYTRKRDFAHRGISRDANPVNFLREDKKDVFIISQTNICI